MSSSPAATTVLSPNGVNGGGGGGSGGGSNTGSTHSLFGGGTGQQQQHSARGSPTSTLTVQKKPRPVGIGCTVSLARSGQGMVVQRVQPESRAQAAGVNESDVILEINNQPVRSLEDVARCLQGSRNDPILKILRGAAHKPILVTLPPLDMMRPLGPKTPFGLSFEHRKSDKTIIVTSVVPGGVADVGGIRSGDVILQIGTERVAGRSENDVKQILGAVVEGGVVTAILLRGDKQVKLTLERTSQRRLPASASPLGSMRGDITPEVIPKPMSHEDLLAHVGPLPNVHSAMAMSSASMANGGPSSNHTSPHNATPTSTTVTPQPPFQHHSPNSSTTSYPSHSNSAMESARRALAQAEDAAHHINDDNLRSVLRTLRQQHEYLAAAEATREQAEMERQRVFDALKLTMTKQAEGLDKMLRQSLLRERELASLVASVQRGEDHRRAAEEARDREEKDRNVAEKVRREEEQRRKNAELERHMLVKQHESALDAFKRNMQKSEGEAWGRLGVLIDSLKSEKASVRAWVDKLNDEHRRVRESVQLDVDRIKVMFREIESRMARVDEYWRLHEVEGRRADLESRQRFEAVEAALRDAQGMLTRDISGRKPRGSYEQ